MIDQDNSIEWIIIILLFLALLALSVYVLDKQRLGARFWARWFRQRSGGTLVIVAIGTFGARQTLRMAETFAAAGATGEVLGVILADFHQEVYGYAKTIGKIFGKERVITPNYIPPGAGQGFMHKMQHDWRTEEIWQRELENMVGRIRRLNAANGSTVTTIYYVLPSWSGHYPIAVSLVETMKRTFRSPVLHIGHINLPSIYEPELKANMLTQPEYPANLGLDGTIVSDDDLDRNREIHDWSICAGVAGLFTANRVDPGQQHGSNPIHSLVEFSKASGGLIGLGVGRGSTALVPSFFGLRKDIPEQDLAIDVANVIQQSLERKTWDGPDPKEGTPHFVSLVVPLDRRHPGWRYDRAERGSRLRVDALKYLPDGRLPDGCAPIWTSAAILNQERDSATILSLWLYPIAEPGIRLIPNDEERIEEVLPEDGPLDIAA